MAKRNLKHLSLMELAELRHEAMVNEDHILFADVERTINILKTSSEELRYVRFQEFSAEYEIVIQFSRGGNLMTFDKGTNSRTISGQLRYLADQIDKSITQRQLDLNQNPHTNTS